MPIQSSIVDDHQGQGRGHVSHGKGNGYGHDKHAQRATEDGVYEIEIRGINHDNPTSVNQTSAPVTLADGSTLNTEVREGSISTGDKGLRLETDSNNGRLRVNVGFDEDQQVTLGELDTLSFDYLIDASTRTDVIPVIRLFVDADGNLATTNDRGELVFEYAYQGLPGTTQDSWQTADLIGDDWVAWQRSGGVNRDEVVNMTEYSDWADEDGFTPAGGLNFNEDSLVLGYSIALGSGNGTNDIYLDNLQVGGVTYDFL